MFDLFELIFKISFYFDFLILEKKFFVCKLCVYFGILFWYKFVYIIYNIELL